MKVYGCTILQPFHHLRGPHTSAAQQLPAPYTGAFTTLPPLAWSPSPYTGEALESAAE